MNLENKKKSCCSSSYCGESSIRENVNLMTTFLDWRDRIGHLRVRCGVGRKNYTVEPGVYAIGEPDNNSPVLVSANYKLSVDRLRIQLTGRNVWILVLDTKGVNVWCAAGKGTFGTGELVSRIENSRLAEYVSHKNLIVPQLGATGVSAWQVKKEIGYNVKFGPVRAEDLPEYIDNGMTVSTKMRKVDFPISERAVLIPADLMLLGRNVLIGAILLALIGGLSDGIYTLHNILTVGLGLGIRLLLTFIVAAVFGPLLLPWLPARAFALKGLWIGLFCFIGIFLYTNIDVSTNIYSYWINIVSWLFISTALSSFVVMNFTGASTFTSLSGVLKEMKYAVPIQIIAGILGVILLIIGRFI